MLTNRDSNASTIPQNGEANIVDASKSCEEGVSGKINQSETLSDEKNIKVEENLSDKIDKQENKGPKAKKIVFV